MQFVSHLEGSDIVLIAVILMYLVYIQQKLSSVGLYFQVLTTACKDQIYFTIIICVLTQ